MSICILKSGGWESQYKSHAKTHRNYNKNNEELLIITHTANKTSKNFTLK